MRTRVLYEVVTHGNMGRPRARNVQDSSLLDSFSTASGAARPSGTMYKDLRNYGFIKADSGEKYMFVMPLSCSWFGDGFPTLGTEVLYDVVKDGKTGKLRAENVQAIMPAIEPRGSLKLSHVGAKMQPSCNTCSQNPKHFKQIIFIYVNIVNKVQTNCKSYTLRI